MTTIKQEPVTNTTEEQATYALFFEYLLVERASVNKTTNLENNGYKI